MGRQRTGIFSVLMCVGVFAACGSATDETSNDAGAGENAGGSGTGTEGADEGAGAEDGSGKLDDSSDGATPPDASDGAPVGSGQDAVWAVDTLVLGESDWAGERDADAWKTIGYNLDGLISTKLGSNHCKMVKGATKAQVQPDGERGIDNSFGHLMTPFIDSLQPDPSKTVTDSVQDGGFTIMLRTKNLGTEANQQGIWAALYAGAELPEKPAWDGTDVWPVYKDLLQDGNVETPTITFLESYVTDHTWVSGNAGTVDLALKIQGFEVSIKIINARITMEMDEERTDVARGIIAGVIESEPFIDELRNVAGAFDDSLCEGSLFDSIAVQIRQASDIMSDGTNGDSERVCDAISIGLGFTAKRVVLGEAVDAPADGENPCP